MQANISLIFYTADFGGLGLDVYQVFGKSLLEMPFEIEHRRFLVNTSTHCRYWLFSVLASPIPQSRSRIDRLALAKWYLTVMCPLPSSKPVFVVFPTGEFKDVFLHIVV